MEGQYHSEAERVAESSINDFLSLLSRTDWDDLGERDGVHGFQKSIDGRTTIKAFGVLEFPAESICNYLLDNSNKKNWDKMLIESKILHNFGNVRIIHESFSAPWPVSGRDFVFALKWMDRGEDILMVAKSIDIGVAVPRGVVRGEVLNSGFLIKKLTPTSSEVTYSVCIDLKGMIPNMLVNQMAKNQVGNLAKIKKAMQRS
jgi:hypothetical protein